jgi:hypothetical protein
LARLEKLDPPVSYFRLSNFGSFRTKPWKEVNLKI